MIIVENKKYNKFINHNDVLQNLCFNPFPPTQISKQQQLGRWIQLPSGTEDIVADSGQTIGAVTTQIVTAPSPAYTNLTVTYCHIEY